MCVQVAELLCAGNGFHVVWAQDEYKSIGEQKDLVNSFKKRGPGPPLMGVHS